MGAQNFFLFGLTVPDVQRVLAKGYRPRDYIRENTELAAALGLIGAGTFSGADPEVFTPLVANLTERDPFWSMPTTPTTCAPSRKSAPPGKTPKAGPASPFSTPPTAGSSPRIARLPSIAMISGTSLR